MNELSKLIASLESRVAEFAGHLGKDITAVEGEVATVRTGVEKELAALLKKLEAL